MVFSGKPRGKPPTLWGLPVVSWTTKPNQNLSTPREPDAWEPRNRAPTLRQIPGVCKVALEKPGVFMEHPVLLEGRHYTLGKTVFFWSRGLPFSFRLACCARAERSRPKTPARQREAPRLPKAAFQQTASHTTPAADRLESLGAS